jgi:hypothetical protein
MIVNRQILEAILRIGSPIKDATNRRTGKTTSAILAALAESMRRPGAEIAVSDSDATSFIRCRELVGSVQVTVAKLGLKSITVTVKGGLTDREAHRVVIINTFCESLT